MGLKLQGQGINTDASRPQITQSRSTGCQNRLWATDQAA